mmetsp:Transcript_76033/g.163196  ORF Transcript_76033/g.163196 Transcript_76033/m.163196 type:complete len:281 (+) Transcript_76033:1466-2308(+)
MMRFHGLTHEFGPVFHRHARALSHVHQVRPKRWLPLQDACDHLLQLLLPTSLHGILLVPLLLLRGLNSEVTHAKELRKFLQWRRIVLVDLVLGEVVRIKNEDRPEVPTIAAVVARTENRDATTLVLLVIAAAILGHLVASHDEPQSVRHAELHREVGPELDADAPVTLVLPARSRGVAPHKVGEDLLLQIRRIWVRSGDIVEKKGLDVVNVEPRHPRQATVHNEDFLLDHGTQGQSLEGAHKEAVCSHTVLVYDLILEPAAGVRIETVHVFVLVVATVDD